MKPRIILTDVDENDIAIMKEYSSLLFYSLIDTRTMIEIPHPSGYPWFPTIRSNTYNSFELIQFNGGG